jgi:glycine/D-amino acid oxidase-like deaminating enzyme
VNPARLALGLRARLIEAGVEVHENSRVHAMQAGRDGVAVRTADGAVRAGHAVLAAGGAQEALRPLRRRLTLTSSHMVMTEPVPDVLAELGWAGGECITDARHLLHYFRTTPDGRIAFGWGGGRCLAGARTRGHAEVDAEVAAEVARHLVRFFPALAGRRIDHAWGGPIDVSPSHTPIVGSLDGRVHYGFGFTGNGVGPSRMVAHALCALALDRRDEHSRLAIVEPQPRRVPPEPFRYIGGSIVRRAIISKEAAEELGREPGSIADLVAGIPDRIGVQVGR